MPDVFTDEAGTYDMFITTSADWTVSSGGMPNADNYTTGDGSIAPTFALNGDAFDIGDGTAWTIEFWFYYTTVRAFAEAIISNALPGTATYAWYVTFSSGEIFDFGIYNTGGTAYLVGTLGVGGSGGSALATGTWYHVVLIKETGGVIKAYLNNAGPYTLDNTPNGSPRVPTSSYRLYLGTAPDGTLDINSPSTGLRISKLAIYNLELSAGQISDHYLAMTT